MLPSFQVKAFINDGASQASRSTTVPIGIKASQSRAGYLSQTLPWPVPAPPLPHNGELQNGSSSDLDVSAQYKPDPSKSIFRSLESYLMACFTDIDCLNASFCNQRPIPPARAASENGLIEKCFAKESDGWLDQRSPFPELDAKTLLLGDFAENGIWWAGRSSPMYGSRRETFQGCAESIGGGVTAKSPRINWEEVNDWYNTMMSLHRISKARLQDAEKVANRNNTIADSSAFPIDPRQRCEIEEDLLGAAFHTQQTLLKASEALLRRPGRPLKHPADCRFLLILLANPLLSLSYKIQPKDALPHDAALSMSTSRSFIPKPPQDASHYISPNSQRSLSVSPSISRYSGVVKRILGLISNLPPECHRHLISWFSRFSEAQLQRLVDLISSFVSHRLSRQRGKKRGNSKDPTAGGLIPNFSGPGVGSSAQLHAALGLSTGAKSPENGSSLTSYSDDWQIKAAAKVMSLLFSANNNDAVMREEDSRSCQQAAGKVRTNSTAQKRAHRHGQLLPTSAFYNTRLDYADLIADFETWESRTGKFSFCQYPMFLSIWAKIHIMEHDARRQMEVKAREAFFNSIMSRKAINQYLVLKVRRDCLVEDSLRGVSEVVGTGHEEIKKGLRIEFLGEEGFDSGGLRKEWFLLLVREVFDPEHGLFVYDEESHYCYFNPNSFETSDQFFLVGVLLGLAIYNSTILDVALPPFAFRKLLASAPNYIGLSTSSSRPTHNFTLDDLAEYRPILAQGLKKLLDYDGDVEQTFMLDFVATMERYGKLLQTPLCPNGERRPVTNGNRREYVDLYIRYLLDSAVSRQYEPFKRGFFTVCGGNALSLFRPEEIELLVRGSDDPLDVATLRAVAIYDGWGKDIQAADELPVIWFWDAFARANPKEQRKLLSFITASDRIPAMGTTSLVIKVVCLGNDCDRFPIARTCFNMIGLYLYQSKEALENKLWRAVTEGEGFGMK